MPSLHILLTHVSHIHWRRHNTHNTHMLPQALTGVLAMAPYAFSLELAVLASSRGLLDLEQWAMELMTQDAVHFVTALLAFMDVRIAVRAVCLCFECTERPWRS